MFFPFLSGTQWPPCSQQFCVSTSHASLCNTSPSVTLHDVQCHPVRLHGESRLAACWRHPTVPAQLRHPRLAGIQGHADGQGGQPLRHSLCSLIQELVQDHHEPAGWLSPEPGSQTALFVLEIPGISPHDLSPVRLLGLKAPKTSETDRTVVLCSLGKDLASLKGLVESCPTLSWSNHTYLFLIITDFLNVQLLLRFV